MDKFEMTPEDYMMNMLQTQKEEKQKVRNLEIAKEDHERRIEELEYNVPINGSLNNYLTKVRCGKIVSWLGGKKSKAYQYRYPEDSDSHYKTFTGKVYAEAYRRFQSRFDVRCYAETRQHQYEDAIKFWEDYEPSQVLEREKNQLNGQLELLEVL